MEGTRVVRVGLGGVCVRVFDGLSMVQTKALIYSMVFPSTHVQVYTPSNGPPPQIS